MKVNLINLISKAMGLTDGKMEIDLLVILNEISQMANVNIIGRTATTIKDISLTV
jgi:hypothetical protein